MRRAREGQAACDGLELGCRRLDPCSAASAAERRGTGTGGEIVAGEHDERLAFADPIAWRHADLAHRRRMRT